MTARNRNGPFRNISFSPTIPITRERWRPRATAESLPRRRRQVRSKQRVRSGGSTPSYPSAHAPSPRLLTISTRIDTLPAPFSLHDLGRVFDARSLIRERGLVLIGSVEVRFRGETIAADPVEERMPPLARTAQRCRR